MPQTPLPSIEYVAAPPPPGAGRVVRVAFVLAALALAGSALVTGLMVESHLHPPLPTEMKMGGGFLGGMCLLFVVIPLAVLGAACGVAGIFIRQVRARAVIAVLLNALAVAVPFVYSANFKTY